MEELIENFADLEGLDPDVVEERWTGSPRVIAEDIFRVMDADTGEYRELTLFDPAQVKVLDAYFYSDARTLSLYKGRRIGYSYVVVLAFLLDGIMNKNMFYPLVGIKEDGAQARINDISNLIEHAKIDIPVQKDTANDIVLWNGTHFKAYSGAPDSSRGDKSAKAVLLDEMAFYEDQEAVTRAYRAFLSLGSDRKMVQVSTPNLSNDEFMRTHNGGTPTGEGGTLSIQQPSFHNADDIDIHTSLFDQEVHPVRPGFDLATVDEEREKDPEGFAQEYLCRPIDDSYAFFSEDSIERAMGRDEPVPTAGRTVMGVDIGISSDDTVASVFQHVEGRRYQVHQEVVDNDSLRDAGITNPDRGNANHVAHLLGKLYNRFSVDTVVLDRTGPGETFQRIVEKKFGRSIRGFNFSDRDGVEDMMGDLNNALRNDRVQLKQNDRLFEELSSMIKEKRRDGARPKFSAKETSETGKDDTAWAAALGSFPPGMAVQNADSPSQQFADDGENLGDGEVPTGSPSTSSSNKTPSQALGSTRSGRGSRGDRSYNSRYSR